MNAALGLIRAVLLGLLAALCLASMEVHAQRGPDIIQDRQRQDAMLTMYVRTRRCMQTAGVAALSRNMEEPAHVMHFMVTVCGDPFRAHLQRDGMDEETARNTLITLTRETYLRDVLRLTDPTQQPRN